MLNGINGVHKSDMADGGLVTRILKPYFSAKTLIVCALVVVFLGTVILTSAWNQDGGHLFGDSDAEEEREAAAFRSTRVHALTATEYNSLKVMYSPIIVYIYIYFIFYFQCD